MSSPFRCRNCSEDVVPSDLFEDIFLCHTCGIFFEGKALGPEAIDQEGLKERIPLAIARQDRIIETAREKVQRLINLESGL